MSGSAARPRAGATSHASRGRRFVFGAVYLGLMALACAAVLELVSRRLYTPTELAVYSTSELAFDPLVGWRGARGFAARVPHGRHPVPIDVAINADGFRDEDWDAKLARATRTRARKVLVLGDSLIYGWANPLDGRAGEQLAARAAQRGRALEVFNAGIPGWGPAHQLRVLPELLARLRPDEVVVVFCTNDYGDSALPYDFRYPFRVYQPFYDRDGRLLFNARVPRRPSLLMRARPLGTLRLWYAFDQLEALARDLTYARHGLPNARTPGVQLHLLADLFTSEELRARFAYVEPTVLSLYTRLHETARAAGARFAFVPSVERVPPHWATVDSLLHDKLAARGVPYLSPPVAFSNYGPWTATWRDGHPNFLWAWLLAERLATAIDGEQADADWLRLPQLPQLLADLDLTDTPAVARQLSESWGDVTAGGRVLDGRAGLILRAPAPGPTLLRLTGHAASPTVVNVGPPDLPSACRLEFGPQLTTRECAMPAPARAGIVFVLLQPEAHAGPQVTLARAELIPAF